MLRKVIPRAERERRAAQVFADHDGVAHRADLRAVGIGRDDVRAEVVAGRWSVHGRHTVMLGEGGPSDRARLWWAVWESGSRAVLDGAAALVASGLRGFDLDRVDVALPNSSHGYALDGVRPRFRRDRGPVLGAGIPRSVPEWAAIRAAQWAVSDRQAALVLCLTLQQRLTSPARLLAAWNAVGRSPRRAFLDAVIKDLCDGAHSLGELDFASACRRRGLSEPSRQVVRTLGRGRVYLDVRWEGVGLVVEVDGGHHALALTPVEDALRQNEVALGGDLVLRIPVIGFRLTPDVFMDQVARALDRLTQDAA